MTLSRHCSCSRELWETSKGNWKKTEDCTNLGKYINKIFCVFSSHVHLWRKNYLWKRVIKLLFLHMQGKNFYTTVLLTYTFFAFFHLCSYHILVQWQPFLGENIGQNRYSIFSTFLQYSQACKFLFLELIRQKICWIFSLKMSKCFLNQ